MRTFLLPAALIAALTLPAQWTGDPSAPLAICDAPLAQFLVQARPDGAGGSYVLWMDQRNGRREIWGQRVTVDGLPLWTSNGLPLLALPGGRHVSNYHVQSLDNGDLFIAYVQSAGSGAGDTVRLARFDANGTSLIEPHPLVGGRTDQPITSTFACNSTEVLLRPDGAAFVSWIGGGRRLNLVAADGVVMHGYDGVLAFTTNGLAPHKMVPDGLGGVVLATMNANSNTQVRLQRFDPQLTAQWPSALTLPPQVGHNVNSFGLESMGMDGFFVSWVTTVAPVGELKVARFNTNGLPAWAEVEKPVFTGAQALQDHQMVLRDGHLLAAWRKQGIATHLYAQKLSLNGDPSWPDEGAVVGPFPGNVGAPRIVGLSDGGALITSSGSAYAGQRLDASGNVIWTEAATISVSPYMPQTSWYDLLATADNGAVTFWHNGSDVFGARVLPSGELAGSVSIHEHARPIVLSAWPVPSGEVLFVRMPVAFTTAAVAVHAADGRMVPVSFTLAQGDVLQLDVSALAPSPYVVRIFDGAQAFVARFIRE